MEPQRRTFKTVVRKGSARPPTLSPQYGAVATPSRDFQPQELPKVTFGGVNPSLLAEATPQIAFGESNPFSSFGKAGGATIPMFGAASSAASKDLFSKMEPIVNQILTLVEQWGPHTNMANLKLLAGKISNLSLQYDGLKEKAARITEIINVLSTNPESYATSQIEKELEEYKQKSKILEDSIARLRSGIKSPRGGAEDVEVSALLMRLEELEKLDVERARTIENYRLDVEKLQEQYKSCQVSLKEANDRFAECDIEKDTLTRNYTDQSRRMSENIERFYRTFGSIFGKNVQTVDEFERELTILKRTLENKDILLEQLKSNSPVEKDFLSIFHKTINLEYLISDVKKLLATPEANNIVGLKDVLEAVQRGTIYANDSMEISRFRAFLHIQDPSLFHTALNKYCVVRELLIYYAGIGGNDIAANLVTLLRDACDAEKEFFRSLIDNAGLLKIPNAEDMIDQAKELGMREVEDLARNFTFRQFETQAAIFFANSQRIEIAAAKERQDAKISFEGQIMARDIRKANEVIEKEVKPLLRARERRTTRSLFSRTEGMSLKEDVAAKSIVNAVFDKIGLGSETLAFESLNASMKNKLIKDKYKALIDKTEQDFTAAVGKNKFEEVQNFLFFVDKALLIIDQLITATSVFQGYGVRNPDPAKQKAESEEKFTRFFESHPNIEVVLQKTIFLIKYYDSTAKELVPLKQHKKFIDEVQNRILAKQYSDSANRFAQGVFFLHEYQTFSSKIVQNEKHQIELRKAVAQSMENAKIEKRREIRQNIDRSEADKKIAEQMLDDIRVLLTERSSALSEQEKRSVEIISEQYKTAAPDLQKEMQYVIDALKQKKEDERVLISKALIPLNKEISEALKNDARERENLEIEAKKIAKERLDAELEVRDDVLRDALKLYTGKDRPSTQMEALLNQKLVAKKLRPEPKKTTQNPFNPSFMMPQSFMAPEERGTVPVMGQGVAQRAAIGALAVGSGLFEPSNKPKQPEKPHEKQPPKQAPAPTPLFQPFAPSSVLGVAPGSIYSTPYTFGATPAVGTPPLGSPLGYQ